MRSEAPLQLPPNWRWRKFGDCAQLVNGRAYAQEELLDEGTPVLRIQNLNGGDRWYYSNLELPVEKYCVAGDLLYAWSASFGPYRFAGPRSIFHYHIWRVIPNDQLDKDFAFHLLEWLTAQIKSSAHGIAMLHMTKSAMEALPVPIPSIAEQRRIADVLDKVDALRAKRRTALAQLDALAQSVFLDLFGNPAQNPKGWAIQTLAELRTDFRYGTSNKSAADGRPTLRIPNVVNGTVDLGDVKLVPVSDDEFERLRLREGDLLFVRTNGNPAFLGRCAVWESGALPPSNFATGEFIFASYLIRGRILRDRANPVYVREMLRTEDGQRQLQACGKTSAGQYNINIEGLGSIKIPCPSLGLQDTFACKIRDIEKTRASYLASAAKFDILFASLQNRAFRGELTASAASKAA